MISIVFLISFKTLQNNNTNGIDKKNMFQILHGVYCYKFFKNNFKKFKNTL